MGSEIPVVLKPQGFNETKAQADGASRALDEVGRKITSLEKLGEVAKKLGPVTLAVTTAIIAVQKFAEGLEHTAEVAGKTASATREAYRDVAKTVADATAGADATGRAAVSGLAPSLQRAAAAGVSVGEAAGTAKRYGLTVAGGADAAAAARGIGPDSGRTLEIARDIQAATGADLQASLGKIAEAVAGRVGISSGSTSDAAARVLRYGGGTADAGGIRKARDAFDSSPVGRAALVQAGAGVDVELAALGRGLTTGGGSSRQAAAAAADELRDPGASALSAKQDAADALLGDKLAFNRARLGTLGGVAADISGRAFGGAGSASAQDVQSAALLAKALREAIDGSRLVVGTSREAINP